MIDDSARIATLRQRCMARKHAAWRDVSLPRARALRASEGVSSWQERQGLATRDVLAQIELDIDGLELLAGRLAPRPASATDKALAEACAWLEPYAHPGGQTGHCELFLEPLLAQGIEGICAEIESRLAAASDEHAAVLRSFLHALEGLSVFIRHAAQCARDHTAAATPRRRKELEIIADTCEHVARHAPHTFREAIQLLWLTLLAVQTAEPVGLVGPGHLDRSLGRFYEADMAADRITRDEALVLIESLYLLVNEFIPDGLAIPVMVGGRNARGEDGTNDVSYLCLEALRRTGLVYPTVGLCWHEGTPQPLVDLAIELIVKGCSTPAFFGDETIQRGLLALGVPPEESCDYINSTCVEITPVGSSNVWVASPYFNLCGLLLEEIDARAADPPASFESFKQGYWKRLRRAVETGADRENHLRRERERRGRKPLQSVFTRDCIGRGLDIDCGGARFNWVECSFVGLANLADSLHVIRREIHEDGRMSLGEMRDVLAANFEGSTHVMQRFLNAYPKYGQDEPEVDTLVDEITAYVKETCAGIKMYPGDTHFVPGAFVWIMHEGLGRVTGATPDGRKAGTAFADGAGPAQGRETKGATAAIRSTTRWDHSPMIGGVAFNMRFSPALFQGAQGADWLKSLVLTYLRQGGFETQINVIDKETLRKARENPEQYRDLVVRIGGYTDYFVGLSSEMQDEIIQRTEYGVA